ncbi:hypothetical protein [Candidatus Pyrohabitans sp.]
MRKILLLVLASALVIAAGVMIKGEKEGEDMKMPMKIKPSQAGVVKAEQKSFTSFEEAARAVDFPVMAPTYIPSGFELKRIAVATMPLKMKTKRGFVNFTTLYFLYMRDSGINSDYIVIMQEPGDEPRGVPKGPEGSLGGTVMVQGVEGRWSRGWWATPPLNKSLCNFTPEEVEKVLGERRWTEEGLRLSWTKDGVTYIIEARGNMSIEELVKIGNSLKIVEVGK